MKITSTASLALAGSSMITQVQAFWRMNCGVIQTGRVDPIINPDGIAGHAHTAVGARNFNTTSTYESLQAASCTSCSIQKDKSAYWTPLLYYQFANGSFTSVPTGGTVVYYLGRGVDRDNMIPFPPGLQILSGSSVARSYDNVTRTYNTTNDPGRYVADRVSFNCLNFQAGPAPETPFMNNTNCPNGLRAQIHLQSCWDGVNLYKSDQSHVAYMSQIDNGVCPPTHPYLMPHLFYEVFYFPNTIDTSDGGRFVFANGDTTGYGFHADFMNGWDTGVLTDAISQCINTIDSGVIEDCPPLKASQDVYSTTNCPEQPPLVNEQVKGLLTSLPGCNPPTSGPAKAVSQTCTTQPSLNKVVNTDGQSPVHGVANSSVVTLASGSTAKYAGCYTDSTSNRALPKSSFTNTTGMSSLTCGNYCQSLGYSVFGTEYAQECWCGSSISSTVNAESDCAMVCTGNSTEYCGGPNRLSVWSITSVSSLSATSVSSSRSSTVASSSSTLTITSSTLSTSSLTASGAASSTTTTTTSARPSSTTTTSAQSSSTTTTTTTTSAQPSSTTITTTLSSTLSSISTQIAAVSSVSTTRSTLTTTQTSTSSITSSSSTVASSSLTSSQSSSTTISSSSISSTSLKTSSTMSTAMTTTTTSTGSTTTTTSTRVTTTTTSTTTIAAASSTPSVNGTTYIGCVSDSPNARTLISYSETSNSMTLEYCAQKALSLNFKYFAVEYSVECFAGNTISAAASNISEARCNMPCKGNSTEMCGGSNALSVFESQHFTQPKNPSTVSITGVTAQYGYLGCYKEGTSGRALSEYSTSSDIMTVEQCVSTCYNKGYAYAGVEWTRECYCSNSGITNGGMLATGGDSECSMLCGGNQTEFCGAGNRLNVYQLKSTSRLRVRSRQNAEKKVNWSMWS